MTKKSLKGLSPTSFENLCFDIIRDMAFYNPTWRTPGADGGRDIEAWRTTVDPTSTARSERWFIECKKYTSAIGWPTVYEKIAHADALDSDFLFIMTTSSASPTCVDRVNSWNSENRRPAIRIWGAHDILGHLSVRRNIKYKYGIEDPETHSLFQDDVPMEISKAIATVHSLHISGRNKEIALDYANTLSRCWMDRMSQLKNMGMFFKFRREISIEYFNYIINSNTDRNQLSLGELLIVLWIIFITEKPKLKISIFDDYVLINPNIDDMQRIIEAPSRIPINYIACTSFSKNEGEIIIQENVYA